MTEALIEAQKAGQLGEVPIGAVIVRDGQIIGRGHNLTRTKNDPTCHAEMEAIRQAAAYLGGWRLIGCDMYVTAEPCAMCAGAIVWARIENLFIGTMDPKAGACGSVFNIVQEKRLAAAWRRRNVWGPGYHFRRRSVTGIRILDSAGRRTDPETLRSLILYAKAVEL